MRALLFLLFILFISESYGKDLDYRDIQAAIDGLSASGGGTLRLRPGVYEVAGGLQLKSNVRLVGSGVDITVLRLTGSKRAHVVRAVDARNIGIEDLTVDGNWSNAGGGEGIRLDHVTNVTIRNVEIRNTRDYGIGMQWGAIRRVRIDRVRLENIGTDGIDIKNRGEGNSDIFISDVTVSSFDQRKVGGKAAIDVRGPVYLSNITVSGVTGRSDGIRFHRTDESNMSGQGSSLYDFHVAGDGQNKASGVRIRASNVWVSNGSISRVEYGVEIDSITLLEGVTVSGITVENSQMAFRNTHGDRPFFSDCSALDSLYGFYLKRKAAILESMVARGTYGINLEPGATRTRLVANHLQETQYPFISKSVQ